MALKIGIVGLPNVGKSTLFNALTRTKSADAANYPFCTIDPNVGIVEVPDHRLEKLAKSVGSEKIIPTAIEFVDIAGLVKGASEGEGLGNQFLSHIRECDAIGHVVRVFDHPNIIHVHGEINPKNDREVIESELILSDLQTLEKRSQKANSDAKSGDKDKKAYAELLVRVIEGLNSGQLASNLGLTDDEKLALRDLHLMTLKPHIYIINVPEDQISSVNREQFAEKLGLENADKVVPISAQLEADLSELSPEEAAEYFSELSISSSGLTELIRTAYHTLGLMTYFTAGPKETRAWTIPRICTAPKAAGVIHTDFEKGFIKAEVIGWEDLVNSGSHTAAKEKGLLRLEGKDYLVKDGDTIHFKFSS